MGRQGAIVEDIPYREPGEGNSVRIDIDDAILKAHALHAGGDQASAPVTVSAAAEALSKRADDAWKAAMDRHAAEESDWSVADAALNARTECPDADEIVYTVNASGRAVELEVLSEGRLVGNVSLNEDGTVKPEYPPRRENFNGPVLGLLMKSSLDQLEAQGATVQENLYEDRTDDGYGKVVNIRFDDVIVKAADRLQG